MKEKIAFLIITSIIFAYPAIQIARGDLIPLVVLSGSMQPLFNPGDIIFISRTKEVRVGDIIAFREPSGKEKVLITHRVINITEKGIKTKGDANEDPDPFLVNPNDVIGKPVFLIPFLGYLTQRNPIIWFIFIFLPSCLLIVGEIKKMFTHPLLLKKIERDKKFRRRKFDAKLFLILFLIAQIPFLICSVPSMAILLGNETIGSSFPKVFVFQNGTCEIAVKNEGKFYSVAPIIIPVFWAMQLSHLNPFLPSIFTILFFPLILTLPFYPIWFRDIRRVRTCCRKRSLKL